MPRYRYQGAAPVRYGTALVNPGDEIDASASPGPNYVLVSEEPVPTRRGRTRVNTADLTPASDTDTPTGDGEAASADEE